MRSLNTSSFFAQNKVTEPQQMDHVIRLNEINLVEQLRNCFERIEINELLGWFHLQLVEKKFHEMGIIRKWRHFLEKTFCFQQNFMFLRKKNLFYNWTSLTNNPHRQFIIFNDNSWCHFCIRLRSIDWWLMFTRSVSHFLLLCFRLWWVDTAIRQELTPITQSSAVKLRFWVNFHMKIGETFKVILNHLRMGSSLVV